MMDPGRASNLRGEFNEQRVVDVIEWGKPKWIHSVRRATPEEDAAGIDVVVMTDVGPLLVQVKSSQHGARKWYAERAERQMRTDIVVVVVRPSQSDESLLGAILGPLGAVRAEHRTRAAFRRTVTSMKQKKVPA